MGKSKKKANTLAVAAVDAAASASPNTGKKGKREALSLAAQPSAKKLKSSNKVHPTKKIQETSSCEEEGCSQSHEQEEEPAGKQVALGKKGCVVAEKGSAADLNNGAAESSEDSSEDEFSDEKLVTKPISQLTEKQKSRNEEEISEEINEESAKQGSSSSEKEASEGSEEGSDEEIEGLEETPAPKKTSVQKDKSSTQKMPNTPATPGSKCPQLAQGKHLSYNYSMLGWAPYGTYWRNARKICAVKLLPLKRIQSFRPKRMHEICKAVNSLFQQTQLQSIVNMRSVL